MRTLVDAIHQKNEFASTIVLLTGGGPLIALPSARLDAGLQPTCAKRGIRQEIALIFHWTNKHDPVQPRKIKVIVRGYRRHENVATKILNQTDIISCSYCDRQQHLANRRSLG